MELTIAFALNKKDQFEKGHFGDADKFNIYMLSEKSCKLISSENNRFKDIDENHIHGSKKKGQSIIQFLKEKNVSILVSKQFGANVKMIIKYFVPVIVYEESTEQVCNTLVKYFQWIHEESMVTAEPHKLFTITNGILKTPI
jgi:predicted Fe-Mo cluster-binding NifX family protein